MRTLQSRLTGGRIAFLALTALLLSTNSFATTEKVVYRFLGTPDGIDPQGGLVADAAGNLYGTTTGGGTGGCPCGTVFELSPPATLGGAWTETILYSFKGGAADGLDPNSTLIFDKQGNLYGTTQGGGVNNPGTIFELSPPATAGGAWTETVLWIFEPNGSNGFVPNGTLVMDASGNLYGATLFGGPSRKGVAFEIIKPKAASQSWSERVLHNFRADTSDGSNPEYGLVLRDSVLYGTTGAGGTGNSGVIFQLTPKPGLWTETILYNFTGGSDGGGPGQLIIDNLGNLYGAASGGGQSAANCGSGCGTLFELSPPAIAGDPWQETTLYSFTGHGDGASPQPALWPDKLGNLYGTAAQGGRKNTTGVGGSTFGTVFKLKAPVVSGDAWTLVVLHDFGGIRAGDGNFPTSALTLLNGLLYGTTDLGGNEFSNGGTVFSVVP
jgi:uncharacterized repeat protein (TIGR03803 family)